jgi:hypothetical protein
MKTFIALIFCSVLSTASIAQSARISGIVKDAKNEAIPEATVRLLKATDSSEVEGWDS